MLTTIFTVLTLVICEGILLFALGYLVWKNAIGRFNPENEELLTRLIFIPLFILLLYALIFTKFYY